MLSGRTQLEETPVGNSNRMKEYWEHRQVADYLEELLQYRAIGTMEEIKKVISFLSCDDDNSIIDDMNLLNQYRVIGTLEELQNAMKYISLAKKHGTVGKVINACAEYEAIGTLEEVKQAVERMKPKKPEVCTDIYHGDKFIGRDYRCSNCGFGIADDYLCCPYCGQYLDWTKGE